MAPCLLLRCSSRRRSWRAIQLQTGEVNLQAAAGELGNDLLGVVAQQALIEHGGAWRLKAAAYENGLTRP